MALALRAAALDPLRGRVRAREVHRPSAWPTPRAPPRPSGGDSPRIRDERLVNRRNAPPLLAGIAYSVLALSWAVTNPPFASPDEPAHYLRSLAVGGLSFRGNIDVDVPAGLWTTRDPACNKFLPNAPASCLEGLTTTDRELAVASAAGLYPPLAYLLPGALARLESNPQNANRAGRLALVAISSVLFVLTAFLLWSPEAGYLSLIGLTVAMTPMVIFVSSMLSNSALETAAGLTFAAAIVRLARPGLTGHGCGPLQLEAADFSPSLDHGDPLDDLRGRALLHPRRSPGIRESVRVGRSRLVGAAAVLVAAAVANRAWEATYGTAVTRAGLSRIPGWTRSARRSRGCPVWAPSGSARSGGSVRRFRGP